jgi:hypothetical protein
MDELTTFINNTDSEQEFSKTGKISDVSCVSCGSLVPHGTPQLHTQTSSQNTHLRKIQLINGAGWVGGGRSGKNRILLTTASISAAVSEDRSSCDKTRTATILLHASW